MHNSQPDVYKLRVKRELAELETVDSVDKQGLRETGGYTFIELNVWQAENPGKTPEKISKQLLKEHGKDVQGVWVRKQRKGYHDFEDFNEVAVEHRTRHEDCCFFRIWLRTLQSAVRRSCLL